MLSSSSPRPPRLRCHPPGITADVGLLIENEFPHGNQSVVIVYSIKKRYLPEFKFGKDKKEIADQSQKGYQFPSTAAEIHLGLALNFSVFYCEIMNSPERACHLAKQAFYEVISELDSFSEESYKDRRLIMQLLRDNLTLLTSDIPKDGGSELDGQTTTICILQKHQMEATFKMTERWRSQLPNLVEKMQTELLGNTTSFKGVDKERMIAFGIATYDHVLKS